MDPTALPTDNLYKFWTLGSMLVVGFVVYFARKRSYDLHRDKRALELDIAKHEVVTKQLQANTSANSVDEDQRRKHEISARELQHKTETLNQLIDAGKASSSWALLGMIVFSISSCVGFSFWYVKAQSFQDESTQFSLREQKAKTELLELELQRAKHKPSPVSSAANPPP